MHGKGVSTCLNYQPINEIKLDQGSKRVKKGQSQAADHWDH